MEENSKRKKAAEEVAIKYYDSLKKIVDQLAGCDYVDSIGHPLKNNVAFRSLERMAKDENNKNTQKSNKNTPISTQITGKPDEIEKFINGLMCPVELESLHSLKYEGDCLPDSDCENCIKEAYRITVKEI